MITRDAVLLWNNLRGLICVYKPPATSVRRVRSTILNNICAELNELDVRPPTEYVAITGDPTSNMNIAVRPNFADHPMVVGPRYQEDEVLCAWANHLGYHTSGVLLLSLRSGRMSKFIRENRPMRAYRIKGVFGQATDNQFEDGVVVERTTYNYIKRSNIDRLLSQMQMSHQKQMFKLCGVDIQSQAAYELACQGPIRPANSKVPIIYGIKCVDLRLPEFTIEVQCVNEYEKYMAAIIHEIGIKLNSTAYCAQIRCIRHGYFTADDALLRKHWTLENIINNVQHCQRILDNNDSMLRQKNVALQQMQKHELEFQN